MLRLAGDISAGMRQLSGSQRFLIVLLLVLGQGFCVGFGPARLAARDVDATPLWPQQVRRLVHMAPPAMEAGAALLLDEQSQMVLYEKNANQRWAPASTTKMMTALVALESGELDDQVVVQASDLTVDSAVGLAAGEEWTLEDLLYILLLPSDNAAARVIARHIAGSEEAFVALMNAKAESWGLHDTHFANPHGLDDPQQYTSAHDLAEIALHGLAQPEFAKIVATSEWQAKGRVFRNLNQLLGTYPGAEGIKTGTTDAAGECLVSAVSRPDGAAICVILGSNDRYRDSRLLLDYYFATYCSVALTLGPKGLNRVLGVDGKEAVLVLRDERRVLLPRWQLPWLWVQRTGQAPVPSNPSGIVGSARFVVGPALIAELPLYAAAP